MGDLIASRRPLTPELLSDIRERGLSGARLRRTLDTVGSFMKRSLDVVLEAAAGARIQAAAYNRALAVAQRELGDRVSPAALRKLIGEIGAETQAIERQIRTLEGELLAIAREAARFDARLEDASSIEAIDPVTGLENRKAFDNALRRAIEDPSDDPVSIFLCRVDRLQRFTDQRDGYQNQLLRLVAHNLAKSAGPRGRATRFNDEILAVTLRQTPLSEAEALAEDIQTELSARKLVRKSSGERLGNITLSIGVAQFAEGEKPRDFVRRALGCLELACHLGCNFIIGEDDPRFAEADIDAA
jgi:diguanylate cyclase